MSSGEVLTPQRRGGDRRHAASRHRGPSRSGLLLAVAYAAMVCALVAQIALALIAFPS